MNAGLRKVTRNRGQFPNEQAALKVLYLAVRNLDEYRGPTVGTRRAKVRARVWELLACRRLGFPWLTVAGKLLSGWVVIDLDVFIDHRPFGQAGRGGHVQTRLRVASAGRVVCHPPEAAQHTGVVDAVPAAPSVAVDQRVLVSAGAVHPMQPAATRSRWAECHFSREPARDGGRDDHFVPPVVPKVLRGIGASAVAVERGRRPRPIPSLDAASTATRPSFVLTYAAASRAPYQPERIRSPWNRSSHRRYRR
jgi:hypothetical protein